MKGKPNRFRALALALSALLLSGAAVGGTAAWLTDRTPVLKNSFTVGDVAITLTESPIQYAADGEVSYGAPAEGVQNAYKLIPGTVYRKDPVVSVDPSSEDCYLFVMFEEKENAAAYIGYTSALTEANGWTRGAGTDGVPANVWYRQVMKTDTLRSWELLAENTITILPDAVNRDTMAAAAKGQLVYTAYAVQLANLTVSEAWEKIAP